MLRNRGAGFRPPHDGVDFYSDCHNNVPNENASGGQLLKSWANGMGTDASAKPMC